MADSKDGEEAELTMFDVLKEQEELEENAQAVLGDSDDRNCTYIMGYVPRQALYACATCRSDDQPGGICLACSYECHEGHELIELYTKRNFRCDCGNKKFPNNKCRLYPNKDELNPENKYNQNFKGVYCSCSRPYPDAADDVPDEMIQCIMCEDWYHGRHLGGTVPSNDDYGEMICATCMEANTFLSYYIRHFNVEKSESSVVDVEGSSQKANPVCILATLKTVEVVKNDGESTAKNLPNGTLKEENKELDNETKVSEESVLTQVKTEVTMAPAFFPDNWRKELCRCKDCMLMYENQQCTFLLDDEDTIQAYEERGKNRSGQQSQYDKGLSALSQMDRVKQMEAIREYNNLKVELKNYLKQFADSKRTVCEKDITDFFEDMQKRKRQRVETHVPYFCR